MLKDRKFGKQDGRRRHLGFLNRVELLRKYTILGPKMKFYKIQDGRRPPIEIY